MLNTKKFSLKKSMVVLLSSFILATTATPTDAALTSTKGNVTSGKGDISRAEFVQTLANQFDGKARTPEKFIDVATNHWAKDAIEEGLAVGFLKEGEYAYKMFQPSKAITRAEMAKMLSRALAAKNSEYGKAQQTLASSVRTLIPIAETYKGGVNKADLSYIGVMMGTEMLNVYSDGKFKPNDKMKKTSVPTLMRRFEQVANQPSTSFSKLNELVEVAKTGTNLTTFTKYTYGANETNQRPLTNVLDKPITFKNNLAIVKLHRLIVTDNTVKGTSVYHDMFVDPPFAVRAEKGWYKVFVDVSITPNKDFGNGSYLQAAPTSFVSGGHLEESVPQFKYGLPTATADRSFFKKGKTKRVWWQDGIRSTVPTGSDVHFYSIKTDDGSNADLWLSK